MSKKQDKKRITQSIHNAALLYKHNLIGKRFLYVFNNRYIEVIYKAENFRHLTGVETNLSAKDFYRKAVQGKLSESQFWFSANHPYQLCKRKIKHIGDISTLAGSAKLILEEIVTDTQSFRFGATNLNFTLCLNKKTDNLGNSNGDCFTVHSLRDENCLSKCKSSYVVQYIISRANDQKKYTDILFRDAQANIFNLPDDVLNLLDESLLSNILINSQRNKIYLDENLIS